jgi:Zn-dependent peptidase ImmA (M78 family)
MVDPFRLIEAHRNAIPVPIFQIVSELGLGPEFRPLDDDVSGWIERVDPADYHIVINANHAATRQRFTAAHELGHFIYHRDLLGAGTGDTRAYRADRSPLPNALIRPRHERQANSFAANLLMPVRAIEQLKSEGLHEAGELAERLGVSEEAMKIRLGAAAQE